jgi:TonB-dependent Receptor Plug Domain
LWKKPVNYRSSVSTEAPYLNQNQCMRHVSTIFLCMIFFLSTVSSQDTGNLKTPGLKILNRSLSLTPSYKETGITMRCMPTRLNDKPLFIIDGIPVEEFRVMNINPDSIESITILKDNMTTALYCRAFSGAVLITTKNANQRTIQIKDFVSSEAIPVAAIDLINIVNRQDTLHLVADSFGQVVTNKIVYGKEYELTVTYVGYKPYRCLINSKIVGKNYTVLLLKDFKTLSLVKNQEPITAMCYSLKTAQSYELISTNELSSDQFRVFPIPAKTGNEIKIEWRKAPKGEYAIDLYNLQGQLIISSFTRIGNETNIFAFQIPIITPGNYLLQMTNKKSGKKHAEKIIIR